MSETFHPVRNPPITELKGPLFRIGLPDEWVERSIYCAGGPLAEGFQASITLTFEHRPDLDNLTSFVDEQLVSLESTLDGFELLDRGSAKLPAGTAQLVRFAWKHLQEIAVRQTQWFLHRAPNIAIITATAHETAFEELTPQFEQAVASFRFQGAGAARIIR